ncbi:LamG domain-containing protein [Nonomuraea sp. B10E15]|uniref:LamG domain-containing protein n=1 Tax=Nonomuraea sp. B10E15 TaxID=3153560 RepID=UPI00325EA8ED
MLSADQLGHQFGATEPILYVGTDGRLRGQLGELSDSGFTPITSAAPVNDGQWHHVVLTVAGEQQKLYLDGELAGELTGTTVANYRARAFVGSGYRANSWSNIPGGPTASGAFAFNGTIDEFAVYGKPLSEATIQAHWAARAKVSNKLTQVTLPSGRIWAKNTYDTATDRLLTHTDRHAGTWKIGKPEVDWVEKVNTVEVIDPRDGKQTYGYDRWRADRLVYEIDQLDFKTSYRD